MRTFTSFDELTAAIGEDLGTSDWLTIEQERVDEFAEATGDHQWIHVDVERAASGPFGGTIAHGYLTLSLIPALGRTAFRIDTPGAVLNYGLNKVRFAAPVPVGADIRLTVRLAEVDETSNGLRATFHHTIEIDGGDKPACVAETVVLLVP